MIFIEHSRFNTPWVAIVLGGLISAAFACETFDNLVAIDLSLYLLALMLEFAALIVVKRQQPSSGGFEIPGGVRGAVGISGVPAVVALTAIFLQLNPATELAKTSISPLLILVGMAAAGPAVWWIATRLRSVRKAAPNESG